jgi:hypothetical protein
MLVHLVVMHEVPLTGRRMDEWDRFVLVRVGEYVSREGPTPFMRRLTGKPELRWI